MNNAILVVMVVLSYHSVAQISFKPSVEYAGLFSKIANPINDIEEYKYIQSLTVGINVWEHNRLTLRTGLGVLASGSREVIEGPFSFNRFYKKIAFVDNYIYVTAPVQLRYSFGKFYVKAGLLPSILVDSYKMTRISFTNYEHTKEKSEIGFNMGGLNTFVLHSELALGYRFGKIYAGVNYLRSLNQIIKDVPRKTYLYGFGFELGYMF